MFFKLSLVCLFLIVYEVGGQYRFDCDCNQEENACQKLNCEEGKGRIVKRVTTCGCCDICIKSLKEGESCPIKYYGMNNGKLQECGPGLVCNKETRKCIPNVSKKCVKQQIEFDNENQTNFLLKERPQCHEFGDFKEVACFSDAICYCVDRNGNRIFGTDLAKNNASMKCDCSRDIKSFPRKVADGNFPRCLPNGNYDPLQCTEELCYCMDSFSQETDVVSVDASLDRLTCYNKDVHENRQVSKCWKEREEQMEPYRNESFREVIGLGLTQCDLDGTYSPVQCEENGCYCVNKDGKPYNNYKAPRNSKKAIGMTCSCYRDKEFLKNIDKKTENMKQLENTKCDESGNYEENKH